MIPVVIFTYEPDGPMAVLSGFSASRAGLGKVYLIEDINNALNADTISDARKHGFQIVTTDFERSGNLNGMECLKGILQTYLSVMQDSGSDYVLKLDSDTLINRTTTIESMAGSGMLLAGMRSEGEVNRLLMGCCMLIHKELVLAMLAFIRKWDGIPGMDNDKLPEDLATARFAVGYASDRIAFVPFRKEGSIGAGWTHGRGEEWLHYYAERFDWVTFGNKKDVSGRRVSRVSVYKAMLDFASHIGIV